MMIGLHLLLFLPFSVGFPVDDDLNGEDLVDYVNKEQKTWKAELNNRFDDLDEVMKKGMMGVKNMRMPPMRREHKDKIIKKRDATLPDSFDARQWWPECPSIGAVRDQSSCGSCWAFGAAEAISDRICVASRGQMKVNISAAHLMSCCEDCGEGCQGGIPINAWNYWVKEGIVTGGEFHEEIRPGCQPYPFPPCEHGHSNDSKHFDQCGAKLYDTPQCSHKCVGLYGEEFNDDKHHGLSAYLLPEDEEAIQKELMRYGPLEITFGVFSDFLHYKSGVYQHTAGRFIGGHAVKLIGWGVEQPSGIPYWLLVNSWNSEWGDHGFFKIYRGLNECGIEEGAVGGTPKLK